MGRYTVKKTLTGFPCVHRSPGHDGHCRFLHGYDRSFTFWFGCDARDDNGFVVDFGDLKPLRAWLEDLFDHTTLVNEDDPALDTFRTLEAEGLIQLRLLPDTSTEGCAKYVFEHADSWVRERTGGRAWCVRVEARENTKNAALYEP